MKQISKTVFQYILILVLMIIGLTAFKTAANMLSDERIQTHIKQSLPLIEEEGVYPQHFINNPEESYLNANTRLDTITELAMIGTAYMSDSSKPLVSAMNNRSVLAYDFNKLVKSPKDNLSETDTMFLSQYWLGASALCRILFSFGTLAEVRQLMLFVFSLIMFLFLVGISKKINAATSLAVLVGLLMVNIWLVPFSLAFSITFFIMFMVCLFVLYYKKEYSYSKLLFITGILTAFFDWMSTPIITFAFPVLIIIVLQMKNNENYKFKCCAKQSIGMGCGWIAGYGTTILSKWLIGSIVLKQNIFAIGLGRLGAGVSNTIQGEEAFTFFDIVKASIRDNFYAMYPISGTPDKREFILMFAVILIMVVVACIFHKPLNKLWFAAVVMVIGAAPYVWFVALKGHCHIHYWFTYRSQAVSVAALFIACSLAVDREKFAAFHKKNKDKFHQIKTNAFKQQRRKQ